MAIGEVSLMSGGSTTFALLFILFAGAYLSAGYWVKVFGRLLPWRPLRCALGFVVLHTLFVMIIRPDGGLGPWSRLLMVDMPAIVVMETLDFVRTSSRSTQAVVFLFVSGTQWFAIGYIYAVASKPWLGVANLKRDRPNRITI